MKNIRISQNFRDGVRPSALAVVAGLAFFLCGCEKAVESVTIQEIDAHGATLKEWKNVRIEWARDPSWTRFESESGERITISTPHRVIYTKNLLPNVDDEPRRDAAQPTRNDTHE